MTGVTTRLFRLTQESHINHPLFNLILNQRTNQLSLEVKKSGKHGLKTLTIGVMVKLTLQIAESLTTLQFNLVTSQSSLEEKKNGKLGPKILTTKAIKPPMLPTAEFHTNQLS